MDSNKNYSPYSPESCSTYCGVQVELTVRAKLRNVEAKSAGSDELHTVATKAVCCFVGLGSRTFLVPSVWIACPLIVVP